MYVLIEVYISGWPLLTAIICACFFHKILSEIPPVSNSLNPDWVGYGSKLFAKHRQVFVFNNIPSTACVI